MHPSQATQYVETLDKAVRKAIFADYEDNMQTIPFTVKMETCYVKVIKKSSSLDHPRVLLFKVIPKNGKTVSFENISDKIRKSIGIYGDISVNLKGEGVKTTVISTKSVNITKQGGN